ncbi:MAG: PLD nuclease N-terminal domain-containing protein [Nocardioidaceae bacterium]
MLKVEGLLGLLVLALWIFSIIDVAGSREQDVRSLPKIAWVFIVLIFPFVGSLAWLIAGRPDPRPRPAAGAASPYPEYDRPGRMRASSPDDDEAFLRQVRERAEEQRRRYRQQRDDATDPDDPEA